jgi:hypothetical protein
MIVNNFEDIPVEGKTIGMIMFEDRAITEKVHKEYLKAIKNLHKKADIVIIDIVCFGMMASFLYKNGTYIDRFGIDSEEYEEYFGEYADYIIMQNPKQQLERFNRVDIPTLDDRCRVYKTQYRVNQIILKTFLQVYSSYPFKIDYAANIWICGYRQVLYQHYFKTYLGFDMDVIKPINTTCVNIYRNRKNKFKEKTKEIIENKKKYKEPKLSLIEELKKEKDISAVYFFDKDEYTDSSFLEVFIGRGADKVKIIHHYE